MTKEEQARRAWREADTVPGRSPERWRRDFRGRLMRRGSYGTRGRYGWLLGRPRSAHAPGVRADVRHLQAVHESTFHHDCAGADLSRPAYKTQAAAIDWQFWPQGPCFLWEDAGESAPAVRD
jgi:hypothetical protein